MQTMLFEALVVNKMTNSREFVFHPNTPLTPCVMIVGYTSPNLTNQSIDASETNFHPSPMNTR